MPQQFVVTSANALRMLQSPGRLPSALTRSLGWMEKWSISWRCRIQPLDLETNWQWGQRGGIWRLELKERRQNNYALKIQDNFSTSDPRSMWKGIKNIINYSKRDVECPVDPSLPDALNTIYARCEALMSSLRSRFSAPQDVSPFSVSTEDETRALQARITFREGCWGTLYSNSQRYERTFLIFHSLKLWCQCVLKLPPSSRCPKVQQQKAWMTIIQWLSPW